MFCYETSSVLVRKNLNNQLLNTNLSISMRFFGRVLKTIPRWSYKKPIKETRKILKRFTADDATNNVSLSLSYVKDTKNTIIFDWKFYEGFLNDENE